MKTVVVNLNPATIHFHVLLRYALKIVKYFNSNLILVHVVENNNLPAEDKERFLEKLVKTAQPLLSSEYQGLKIKYDILFGKPKLALTKLALAITPDLLLTSTYNNNFMYTLLYGDESVDIAQSVPCPVLLVPSKEIYETTKRIIYTTEFLFDDLNSLEILERWSEVFDAKLLCLHIAKSEDDTSKAMQKMEVLKKKFQTKRFSYQIVVGEDVIREIKHIISLNETDLIVGLHRRKKWWATLLSTSITDEISKYLEIPMLIFKE